MSMMCKLSNECCRTKGACTHEKMMMIAAIVMVPLVAHFALHWF